MVREASDGSRLLRLDGGGAVIESYPDDPDADGRGVYRVDYDQFRNAKLHFALWVGVNRFERPDRSGTQFIPTKIVARGKEWIAAWLYLGGCHGSVTTRRFVAENLDIRQQTVSQYLTRVRSTLD